MPINNITQTISELPASGKRGIDVQTIFVTKQEDFQDHLQGTTVTELNTLKDQLNTRIGEINSTATTMNGYADTASAGASTATTKAGEASTSASGALTSRNQAETFKNNASASATKASQWADNAYNAEVETGRYSAKHWSTVAENATSGKMDKVTSTDNAIVRFNGTTGAVQDSSVLIDDNGNLNITGTSKRITGDFSTLTDSNRLSFETSTPNSLTVVNSFPNGTGLLSAFRAFNKAQALNSSFTEVYCDQTQAMIRAGRTGAGTYQPMTFNVNGAERMRIDTSGNVLVTGSGALGYGTGSGGSVTQLTSKSTTVTLNKTTGHIIMNNAALAAGNSARFLVLNNLVGILDTVVWSFKDTTVTDASYNVWISSTGGGFYVNIKNISGGSLSEALGINFTIIKGAIS